ncbi:MAG TPA: hypothetical protein HPQ00_04835 [Magnetococcales bacterium]|nr:hypothetical protein [Magnetococcales bacterium]
MVSSLVGSNTDITFSKEGNQNLSLALTFDSSAVASLEIPRSNVRSNANPVSLLLHLTGTNVGSNGVHFYSVTNPKGESLDMSIQPCVPYYCGVLIPRTPAMTEGVRGTWNFRLQSTTTKPDNFKVYVTLKSGSAPSSATKLVVAPYMVKSNRFNTASVKEALAHMVAIYAKNELLIQLNELTAIDESRFSVVDLDFTNATTSALISRGATNVVNIFFVDDFNDYGALGIAAAIPGSMGLAGGHNGILIGLAPHRVGGVVDSNFMGETAAHEMGHFLGLFHTTESTGTPHDPLQDTPECPSSRDANKSGILELEECAGLGAENLMFWTPFTSWAGVRSAQEGLTSDQKTILRYAPIAQ